MMIKEERYIIIEDAGEWIIDRETDEYITLEEACQKLNDYEDNMEHIGSFISDFLRMLDQATTEGGK